MADYREAGGTPKWIWGAGIVVVLLLLAWLMGWFGGSSAPVETKAPAAATAPAAPKTEPAAPAAPAAPAPAAPAGTMAPAAPAAPAAPEAPKTNP